MRAREPDRRDFVERDGVKIGFEVFGDGRRRRLGNPRMLKDARPARPRHCDGSVYPSRLLVDWVSRPMRRGVNSRMVVVADQPARHPQLKTEGGATMNGADLVRRSVEALNHGDATAYAAGYAVDAVVHDPLYPEPLKGREAIGEDIAALLRAVPDAVATVRSVIEESGQVAAEVTITGTHDGVWKTLDGELPATGRPVTLRACDVVEVGPDGLYTTNRRYYDLAGFLDQLGFTA